MASHFPFKPAKLDSTGNEDSSQVQETRIEQLVKECKEKCHTPQDHCFGPGVVGLTGTNPSAVIEGENGGEVISIVFRWTGHLSLPKLSSDELGINKEVTPEVMHKCFEQFRGGVAGHIAPEMPPGRIIEMSCFDPNRCSCLHYPGANILPSNWELTPPNEIGRPEDMKYRTCRIHAVSRLKLLQPLQNNGDGLYYGDGLLGQQILSGGSHKAAIHTPGRAFEIKGRAAIGVTIGICRHKYRCLEVKYEREIFMEKFNTAPLDVPTIVWYQALDPDSYNLQEDNESFGTTWCRQPGCPNYYRYLKSLLVPTRDMRRGCCPLSCQ